MGVDHLLFPHLHISILHVDTWAFNHSNVPWGIGGINAHEALSAR